MALTDLCVDFSSAFPSVIGAAEVDIVRGTGRLHYIGVHFPVALALVAVGAECWRMLCRRQDLSPLTLPLLWIAAICALGASTTGWLHAGYEYGDDASNTLFLHRWIGIGSAVALTALALWSCKVTASLRANRASAHASLSAFRYAAIVVAAAVGFVGHLGGELTHGEDYTTEYIFPVEANADEPADATATATVALTPKDEFFLTQVRPILVAHCFECHGPRKQKGGMRFDSSEWLFNGEEEKWAAIPFEAENSPLIHRVNLDRTDPDAMPPEGEGLTDADIETLTSWINEGAAYPNVQAGTIGARGVSSAALSAALAASGSVALGNTSVVEIDPAIRQRADVAMKALLLRGVLVQPLAAESPLLDVNGSRATPALTDADVELLADLSPVVANLNLSKSALTDTGFAKLGSMPHLERLRLDGTSIGDEGLASLGTLARLESINLVATKVTEASSDWMHQQPLLKRVYVWQTALDTPEMIKKLAGGTPLEVVGGDLPPALATTPPMPIEEPAVKEPETTP